MTTKKNILDYKHVQSVRVIVLQDAETQELAGKIIANYSDSGVCTSKVWIYKGKFSEGEFFEYGFGLNSAGGSGYDKLSATICAAFRPFFDSYQDVAELDSGAIESWFRKHGYIATTIL